MTLRPRSAALLTLASLLGLAAFVWPLFTDARAPTANTSHAVDAPWIFLALMPLLVAVVLGEISDGGLDSKAIAMLGVLAACGGALRLFGGGPFGGSAVFFLLVPAARVFGRGFGFVLGALTILASAFITGGVGPWLPFQMFGAAWVGFFAGCLPPARGRWELALLAAYAVVAALAFGLLLDLWFWPFVRTTEISFVPGLPLAENLRRFWAFHAATALGFDIPRSFVNALLVLGAGRPVLLAMRRAARRAAWAQDSGAAGQNAEA